MCRNFQSGCSANGSECGGGGTECAGAGDVRGGAGRNDGRRRGWAIVVDREEGEVEGRNHAGGAVRPGVRSAGGESASGLRVEVEG